MSFPVSTSPLDTEQQLLKVKVWRRATVLLVLLALMVLVYATAFAWMSSLLFLVAIVTISMAIARMVPLKPSALFYLMYSGMILLCLFMAFSSAITALFSGVSTEYARCTSQATTIARAQKCNTDMEANLQEALRGKR